MCLPSLIANLSSSLRDTFNVIEFAHILQIRMPFLFYATNPYLRQGLVSAKISLEIFPLTALLWEKHRGLYGLEGSHALN